MTDTCSLFSSTLPAFTKISTKYERIKASCAVSYSADENSRNRSLHCQLPWRNTPYPKGPSKYMLRSSTRSMMPRMLASRPMGRLTNAALWLSLVLTETEKIACVNKNEGSKDRIWLQHCLWNNDFMLPPESSDVEKYGGFICECLHWRHCSCGHSEVYFVWNGVGRVVAQRTHTWKPVPMVLYCNIAL